MESESRVCIDRETVRDNLTKVDLIHDVTEMRELRSCRVQSSSQVVGGCAAEALPSVAAVRFPTAQ